VSTVAIGALSGTSQTLAEYPQELQTYLELVLKRTPQYELNLLQNSRKCIISKGYDVKEGVNLLQFLDPH
jgi:hypothetical protein